MLIVPKSAATLGGNIMQVMGQYINLWQEMRRKAGANSATRSLGGWLNKMNITGKTGSQYAFRFQRPGTAEFFSAEQQGELTALLRDVTADAQAVAVVLPDHTYASLHPVQEKQFTNYYTNSENRLAIAAGRAICKQDRSISYNPLFLHGGTGLGKSHLLNAIAWEFMQVCPEKKIRYLTSEMFQSQFAAAMREDDLSGWRELNASADLFIMDDIHLLTGNNNIVNEVLHLFDILHANKSQIVISSSLMPKKMTTLPECLVSRLQWGLVIEIQKPELATREDIVRNRVKDTGLDIQPQLVSQIAFNNNGNIRELEGSITAICSHASLLDKQIDKSLIDSLQKTESTGVPGSLMAEDIVEVIAEYFRVKREHLLSKSRIRSVAYPRQVGMYLAKIMTGSSLEEIGRVFGGRDHSTVKHGCEKIKEQAQRETSARMMIEQLKERVASLVIS